MRTNPVQHDQGDAEPLRPAAARLLEQLKAEEERPKRGCLIVYLGAADRVRVAIDHQPIARDLLRNAWRLGKGLHADAIMAVSVVDREKLDPVERKRLEDNLLLAEDLGIVVHQVDGVGSNHSAIGDALARFAHEHHVTQMVLGQSARSRWEILRHGSVINYLLREAKNVDLHLVADRANER